MGAAHSSETRPPARSFRQSQKRSLPVWGSWSAPHVGHGGSVREPGALGCLPGLGLGDPGSRPWADAIGRRPLYPPVGWLEVLPRWRGSLLPKKSPGRGGLPPYSVRATTPSTAPPPGRLQETRGGGSAL